jgi:Putative MetA-pathway of phenol degradation
VRARPLSKRIHAPLLAFFIVMACRPATILAGPINTDVALTPPKGGSIFRLQYIYSESDARGDVQHVNASIMKGTYVFGLKENLALFLTVPYIHREIDVVKPQLGRFERSDSGVADLTFLAKYRFWQDNRRPGETLRWAAIGGLNIRSGDSDFTSDSYDPIVGTVFTWQRDRGWFDADLLYQFNTGGGESRHDALRYDLAYCTDSRQPGSSRATHGSLMRWRNSTGATSPTDRMRSSSRRASSSSQSSGYLRLPYNYRSSRTSTGRRRTIVSSSASGFSGDRPRTVSRARPTTVRSAVDAAQLIHPPTSNPTSCGERADVRWCDLTLRF